MKHPDDDLWSLAGAITPAQFNVIGTEQMSVFVCGQVQMWWACFVLSLITIPSLE